MLLVSGEIMNESITMTILTTLWQDGTVYVEDHAIAVPAGSLLDLTEEEIETIIEEELGI
jgi:hypothetical protein